MLYANLVWPGHYLIEGYRSPFAIIIGLSLETGFLMGLAKIKAHKAFPLAILANFVSAAIGWFVFPELSYRLAQRDTGILGWFLTISAAWLLTTIIETPIVWSFVRQKRPFRQQLLACSAGNLLSVMLALCFAAYPGGSPPSE